MHHLSLLTQVHGKAPSRRIDFDLGFRRPQNGVAHPLAPGDPLPPTLETAAWFARCRFERECESERLNFSSDSAPRHMCWATEGPATICAINTALGLYGCRECKRTHLCKCDWNSCLKVVGPTGSILCAFSGREIVADDETLGTYDEESRVGSMLNRAHNGTRVNSREFFQVRAEGAKIDKQHKRTATFLERDLHAKALIEEAASAALEAELSRTGGDTQRQSSDWESDGSGDSDDADDGGYDQAERSRDHKRRRYSQKDEEEAEEEGGEGDAEEDLDFEGDDASDVDDAVSNDQGDVADDADAGTDKGADNADLEEDKTNQHVSDKITLSGDGGHDDAGDAGKAAVDSVYRRLGVGSAMRGGLSAEDVFRSNRELLTRKSDVAPPWEAPLSNAELTPACFRLRRYMADTEDRTSSVVAALARFDKENDATLNNYVMSESGQDSIFDLPPMVTVKDIEATSVSTEENAPRRSPRDVYERTLALLIQKTTNDVGFIVAKLCADASEILVRTEIYTRICHRLVRLVLRIRPSALSRLDELRVGYAMLLDLLAEPYMLPDSHGTATGVGGQRGNNHALACSAPSVMVWNGDPWLSLPEVTERYRLLIIIGKPASMAHTGKRSENRFPSSVIKSWANQIKALLHATPISPYAMRHELYQ